MQTLSAHVRFDLSKDGQRSYVNFVNERINMLTEIPSTPLGPSYSEMSKSDVQDSLILYRLGKGYERPRAEAARERKIRSLEAVKAYDAAGIRNFDPATMELDPFIRKALYETRNNIRAHARSYVFDVGSLEITNGETVVSARGDTSILAKLRDVSQWNVTTDNFDLAVRVCYTNRALKRQAKYHFWRQKRDEHGCLSRKTKAAIVHSLYSKVGVSGKSVGYSVFYHMMEDIVTFVRGARFTTVPKNNEKDRVIECEALLNMIVQRVIAAGIKKLIKKHFEIDLERSQDLHKKLITDTQNATVDLANASNSVWMAVVEWFLGDTHIFKHISSSRSEMVLIDDEYCYLNMVAPMGNGYTFELMTWLLLELSRYLDDFSFVYGDDIIVDKDVAANLVHILSTIGFQTNVQKTFLDGPFRESCGGFTYNGEYLTSYDFSWAPDMYHALINVNKLRIAMQFVSTSLRIYMEDVYHSILKVTPALCFATGDPRDASLDQGILVSNKYYDKVRWSDLSYRKVHALMKARHAETLVNYQISHMYVKASFYIKSKQYRVVPKVVSDPHWISHYLYGGRVTAPTYRHTQHGFNLVLCELGSPTGLI